MKRSSDRHQRNTEKRDEHAKNAGTEESQMDQTLADSFPASDAPLWTLGVKSAPQGIAESKKRQCDWTRSAKIDCVHSLRDGQRADSR